MMSWKARLLLLSALTVGWPSMGRPVAAQEPDNQATESENVSEGDDPQAGHSYHGDAFNEGPRQAAYLMGGTGHVKFPVASQVSQVQEFINQGVGQLHGFWYFEAERSFRQAAALDPDCAAAYWGMAMANANNRARAKKFIKEAQKRKDKDTPRVQKYIDALANLLEKKSGKEASQAYIKALERIVYDHPKDIEAQAFIALHLWEGRRTGLRMTSHLAVEALIKQVLAVEPMHPAHHYCIHLWDSEKPERALASAALCGQSAPSIAHMWHMPGHIYSRLKRYPDAVWQQEASARTDHAQMMRDQLLPDQIHNFAHNNEWLIRNLIFIGRIDDALDLAKNMISLPRHPKYNTMAKFGSSTAYGRRRLIQVLTQGELWQDTIELAGTPTLEPTDRPNEQLNRLRLLGRAHLRSGHQDQGIEVVAQLESLLCEEFAKREDAVRCVKESPEYAKKPDKERQKMLDSKRRSFNSRIKQIERSLDHLYGLLAAQSGSPRRAIGLLKEAGDMDRHYVASLHVEAGEEDEAVKLVADYVRSHKNEVIPLANQASILWKVGRKDEASDVMKQLREISAYVDLDLPAMVRLEPLVADLGWPKDWRVAATPANDVGDRPDLDSLGPFRWQPTLAKDWTLANAKGESISLADYRGRPVIVIFYLGYGCLHCAEQLQAFGPHTDDFRAAGIDLVAVSSDDTEGLKVSVENYDGGDIPFPLVADNDLSVFRQYRVYDDFERQPLHGTFLVDAQGRVRWHDISYEPFMDYEFVLNEAQRLLGQDNPPAPALAQRRRP